MTGVEQRTWTAPDGNRYTVRLGDRVVTEGNQIRRIRRAVFVDRTGEVAGDVAVPGYFSLSTADSVEIERLWRMWAG